MKKALITLATVLSVTVISTPLALAQSSSYAKKKAIIFKDGDQIWGMLLKPSGTFITAARRPEGKSLIEYRIDFKPEMLRLMQEL